MCQIGGNVARGAWGGEVTGTWPTQDTPRSPATLPPPPGPLPRHAHRVLPSAFRCSAAPGISTISTRATFVPDAVSRQARYTGWRNQRKYSAISAQAVLQHQRLAFDLAAASAPTPTPSVSPPALPLPCSTPLPSSPPLHTQPTTPQEQDHTTKKKKK
eukprot:2398553-Rhodomonas_salina.1